MEITLLEYVVFVFFFGRGAVTDGHRKQYLFDVP